jgi:UDPglucose 6-dehydrogenase
MRIVMIGSGYVGLVSGACFADFGHDVVCVDKMPEKIEALKNGHIPIFEPGLDVIVANNAKAGRLSFTTDLSAAVANADVVFIAVGTPSRRGDGHADLGYVYAAAKEIAHALDGFTVIVTKSTVPVGTGDEVERIIHEENPSADFAVVSNPEFLREGAAIEDFKRPDRIVVGLSDERARPVMTEVYRPLYLNQSPLLFTTRRASELIKYAANAFLAMKITFINEMADLCEKVGANVQDVSRGIGLDGRIGPKFLHAGPGYGGSCFPKDTLALAKTAQDYDAPVRLIETTIAINDNRKRAMGNRHHPDPAGRRCESGRLRSGRHGECPPSDGRHRIRGRPLRGGGRCRRRGDRDGMEPVPRARPAAPESDHENPCSGGPAQYLPHG